MCCICIAGMNNSNSRNSMHIPQQQSVLPKPVSKAEQQPKSYKQAPATNSKQQHQSSTQASDGSNYMQALASISNQLPSKRPLLNSSALSQLSAVTNQPSHSPTQVTIIIIDHFYLISKIFKNLYTNKRFTNSKNVTKT